MIDGLSLSGAADNIPFHTGAIEVLGENGIKPTVGSGTSSGAIIIAFAAQYAPEDLAQAGYDATIKVLDKIDGIGKVSSMYLPPYVAALKKTGLRSTKKLKKVLDEMIDVDKINASDWDIRVIATNLRTGKSTGFNPATCRDFIQAVRMSASYPGLFEAVRFEGGSALFTDGILDTAPIGHCIKLGADRVISVSSADPLDTDGWDDSSPNTLQVAFRVISLMQKDVWRNDLKAVENINLLVRAGNLPDKKIIDLIDIRPSVRLGKSTNFDKTEAKRAHELGRSDTLQALRKAGATGSRNHV